MPKDKEIDKHRPKMKLIRKLSDVDFSKGEVILQAKADGEFTVLFYYRDDCTHTINRYGNMRTADDFPALGEFVTLMKKNMPNVRHGKILVELYARDPKTGIPLRLPEYIHNMKSEGGTKVCIGAWGIIEPYVTIPFDYSVEDTLKSLRKAIGSFHKRVHVLPWVKVQDLEELQEIWDAWVVHVGWEGLVIRQGKDIYKIKPEHDCDCVIVGINKKDGKLLSRGEVGSVKLALMKPDGTFIEVGSTGGFTHEMRRDLYRNLVPLKVGDEEIVEDKKTIWVEPLVIIEVKYTEIFKVKEHKNKRNYNLLLQFDPFKILGKERFVRFRHPRFSRLRGDKTVTPDDLRLDQI